MSKSAIAEQKLDRLFAKLHRTKNGEAALMSVSVPEAGFAWSGQPAGTAEGALFRIASCSKLFAAALVFQQVDRGALDLDTPIRQLLDDDLSGIHTLGSVDYSGRISVRHLISNTSGLANYFGAAPKGQQPILARIGAGEDVSWTFADMLAATRALSPNFAPGTPGRAHYSDTNFQLVSRILERLTGMPFDQLVARDICAPLGLQNTFVFTAADAARYDTITPVRSGQRPVRLPRAMACLNGQGGIVSTLADCQAFVQGFMQGRLFATRWIDPAQQWNRVFFPFRYGLGMMRLPASPLLGVAGGKPLLYGHSGSSGVIMFHDPANGAYFCGSTNQFASRGLAYRFLVPAVAAVRALR
jgi:CubicO group peptidase (beta-lactamase class C family)